MISWLVFLILCGFCITIQKKISIDFLTKKIFLLSFVIKLIYGFLFIFIFKYWFGNGILYGDTNNFLNDAKAISLIVSESPLTYFKVLLGGIDDSSPEISKFIQQTNIWSYIGKNELLNDNRLIIKLNSVIHLISNNNVYIHGMIHSFLSFIGIVFIYLSFSDLVKNKKVFWLILIILPSLSFWGSGISKESIVIFSIGLFCFGWYQFYKKKYILSGFILLFSTILFIFNKPHIGMVMIPLSLLFVIGYLFKWNLKVLKIVLVGVLVSFVLIVTIPNKLNVVEKISFRQQEMINISEGGVIFNNDTAFFKFDYEFVDNFEKVNDTLIKVNVTTNGSYRLLDSYDVKPCRYEASDKSYRHYLTYQPSGSYFKPVVIDGSKLNLFMSIPSVLIDVLIRPFPWDNGDTLKIFSFSQNILILIFLVVCVLRRRLLKDVEKWILLILILWTLFIILLVGWTTPIFGALVRYKMPVDLFFVIISFILLKSKKHEKV